MSFKWSIKKQNTQSSRAVQYVVTTGLLSPPCVHSEIYFSLGFCGGRKFFDHFFFLSPFGSRFYNLVITNLSLLPHKAKRRESISAALLLIFHRKPRQMAFLFAGFLGECWKIVGRKFSEIALPVEWIL